MIRAYDEMSSELTRLGSNPLVSSGVLEVFSDGELRAIIRETVGYYAPRLDDFRWRDFERNWGVGFRFGGDGGVFLRLDVAFGGEGPRTWLRFGHVF